jgi:hypothetical protein
MLLQPDHLWYARDRIYPKPTSSPFQKHQPQSLSGATATSQTAQVQRRTSPEAGFRSKSRVRWIDPGAVVGLLSWAIEAVIASSFRLRSFAGTQEVFSKVIRPEAERARSSCSFGFTPPVLSCVSIELLTERVAVL